MSAGDKRGFLFLASLSARDRRAILLGAAVLLPAFLYVFAVKPYRAALQDTMDRVQVERELLRRERDLLQSADQLPEAIQQMRAQVEVHEDRLVKAESGVLAETELTDFLESAAFQNRVLLEEIRSGELGRGEEPPPGLSVVRLHLRGESDLEGILSFLDEIERSRLFLRIRGLALEPQVSRNGSNPPGRAGQDAVPTGVVELQLIVDGFARVLEVGS